MHKNTLYYFLFFFIAIGANGQGLVNDGAIISITSGANINIADGHFLNRDNGAYTGTLNLAGNMVVQGNWTNNSAGNVLTAGSTGTVTLSGTTQQFIQGTTATNFYNLLLANTFGTSPQCSLKVNTNVLHDLTLPATNNIGCSDTAITLALGKDASNTGELKPNDGINYTGGYLIGGSMKRWYSATTNSGHTGLFPLGVMNGATLYNRYVQVEYTTAPTTGGTLRTYWKADPMLWNTAWLGAGSPPYIPSVSGCAGFEITSLCDEGYWQANARDGLTGGAYKISLRGDGLPNATYSSCYLTALKASYNNPGLEGDWNVNGTHVAPTGGLANPLVVRTGATGFSKWGLAGGGEPYPLPVELLNFKANCVTNGVNLQWTTASETNNDYFNIERSNDATNWTVIAQIPGSGNSNQITNYSYIDEIAANATTYYRLKQTDFDGAHEYFNPVAVNCASDGENITISVYPNPFKEIINIEINNFAYPQAQIRIYDVIGKIISTEDFATAANNSINTSYDLRKLAAGVYFVEVSAKDLKKNFKIVKN